eukprot:GGOE01015146.1.p1 GENE.GGOE01015146.1~~GGOE01015146.1.p1  ORF type:complete len:844 (+),score=197.10 GGOE01015146.1:42-2573(+)
MGVHGLTSFLQSALGRTPVALVDLKVGRRRHFLVDGPSLAYALYGAAGLDWMCGGQWQEYSNAVALLVQAFATIDAVLVVFFERGAPPCKLREKLRRCKELSRRAESHLRDPGCVGQQGGSHDYVLLPFITNVLVGVLRCHGIQVCFCTGEADLAIAQYCQSQQDRVAAVLTSDSDFFVLPCDVVVDVTTIHWAALLHGGPLVADFVVKHDQVESALGTPHLPMFAVLAGCDYTAPISYYQQISAGWTVPVPGTAPSGLPAYEPPALEDGEGCMLFPSADDEQDIAKEAEGEECTKVEGEVEAETADSGGKANPTPGPQHRFSAIVNMLSLWQPTWSSTEFLAFIAENIVPFRQEAFLNQAAAALSRYSPPLGCPMLHSPSHRPPLGPVVVHYPALEVLDGFSAHALARDILHLTEWVEHGDQQFTVHRVVEGEMVAELTELPRDLPFPNLPQAVDMGSAGAVFRYAASVAAHYAAKPPALPAADHLKLVVLALCHMASHPANAVCIAELDCLLLQSLLCYHEARLEVGHLAEAKHWVCHACNLTVLAKERQQHLSQYHARSALTVHDGFRPEPTPVKLHIQGLSPGTTREAVMEQLIDCGSDSILDVTGPRPMAATFRVVFRSPDAAVRAAVALRGRCLNNRLISVEPDDAMVDPSAAREVRGDPSAEGGTAAQGASASSPGLRLGNLPLNTPSAAVLQFVAGLHPSSVCRIAGTAPSQCIVTLGSRSGAEVLVRRLSLQGLRCRLSQSVAVRVDARGVRLGLHFQATLYALADLVRALDGGTLLDVPQRLFDGITLQVLRAKAARGEDVTANAPAEFASMKASVLATLKSPLVSPPTPTRN